MFVSLIALVEEGRPVVGVIEAPMTRERWVGQRGRRTTWQGEEVSVAGPCELQEAVLYSTSPDLFLGENAVRFRRVADRVRYTCYGGDGYLYGMLARGDIDLVIESDLSDYDVAALIPVVEGAGGRMTTWGGE